MANSMHDANMKPDFDASEQELHDLLGEAVKGCPSVELLMACGQEVLPPEAELAVQRHMAQCRLCSQLVSDLGTLPQEELSPAQSERIAARLPMQPRAAGKSWQLYAGAVAAAAIVAVALTVVHARRVAQVAVAPVVATAPHTEVAMLEPELKPLAAPGLEASALLTRGAAVTAEPSTEVLLPAFMAYNRGNYALAAERLAKLQGVYPRSRIIPLYLGVSELFLHRDAKARANLSLAERTAAPGSRDAAEWYAAIAAERVRAPETHALYAALCAKTASKYSAESCRVAATIP